MQLARWGENGWTHGQYSLFRVFFGLYLAVHFAQLLPWGEELFSNRGMLPQGTDSPLLMLFPNVLALSDSPAAVTALLAAGVVAALCFAAGCCHRVAAVVVWYALTCLFGRNPLIANPALPFVSWMLLAHALKGKRGSAESAMPAPIFAAAWVVMSVAYTYSGYTKLMSPSWMDGSAVQHVLENPLARPTFLREWLLALPAWVLQLKTWTALGLELLFAPLAMLRRLRPWLWLAMLGMHVGLLALIDFADLSLGMVFLHWFTFDPAWVRPKAARGAETIFYDGSCGLCHGSVKFALQEERSADGFTFAPLGGEHFLSSIAEHQRTNLPDSVVILTDEGRLLLKSAGVRHVLARLGGMWRIVGWAMGALPSALMDFFYDAVARVRKKIFAPPPDVCPVLPPELRKRFKH